LYGVTKIINKTRIGITHTGKHTDMQEMTLLSSTKPFWIKNAREDLMDRELEEKINPDILNCNL